MSAPTVVIHTDGSCRKDNKGGWAATLRHGRDVLNICGDEADTTNNRMELLAVIKALSILDVSCRVTLYTDSKYVCDGMNYLAYRWAKRGWKTKDGGAVKNKELWQQLLDLKKIHRVKARWVKGHAGHVENEVVNSLAQAMSNDVITTGHFINV